MLKRYLKISVESIFAEAEIFDFTSPFSLNFRSAIISCAEPSCSNEAGDKNIKMNQGKEGVTIEVRFNGLLFYLVIIVFYLPKIVRESQQSVLINFFP